MPPPDPDASGAPAVPRRAALAALGVAAAGLAAGLSGCTDQHRGAARSKPRTTRTSDATNPDLALAATVLAGERLLLARVEATLRQHRTLAPALTHARDVHRAHIRLLARAVPDRATTTASPTPQPSPRVPHRVAPALAAVVRAEQHLAGRHRHGADVARSGAFARVVAVMAAAAAQQAAHLASAGSGG